MDIETTPIQVTREPKDVALAVMPNLTAGDYLISNVGGEEVRVAKATSVPDPSTRAYHPVLPNQSWGITIKAGYQVYVWCPLSTAEISITDAT